MMRDHVMEHPGLDAVNRGASRVAALLSAFGGYAAAAAAILFTGLSTYSSGTVAQTYTQAHPCPSLDPVCLDDAYFAACAERGSSMEKCLAWNAELRDAFYSPAASAAVGGALAGSYFRLAQMTQTEDASRDYLDRARQVCHELIAAYPDSTEPYILLSILDSADPDQRLAWQREAAVRDGAGLHVRFFVPELLRAGTEQSMAEAVEFAEALYDQTPPGPARWDHALLARRAHVSAISQHPGVSSTADLAAFEQRVRADSGWNEALQSVASPAADPIELRHALPTLCATLQQMFGDEACINGLERAMQSARDAESGEAQAFADAVAAGIAAFRPAPSIIEPEFSWRREFRSWLDELVLQGLDSVMVYEAMARTSGSGLQGILDARLVIVEREPDSPEAQFEAGKAYYDMRQWEGARDHLELALELTTDDALIRRIEGYLRQARYEIDVAQ